jgi:hypothetical protein
MIGAMVRHLKSLRRMTRDHGWIHTLLEEAENERMHLLTALELRRPGPLFKIAVIGTQVPDIATSLLATWRKRQSRPTLTALRVWTRGN